MPGSPVRPEGSANPDIKDNAAQRTHADGGRQQETPRSLGLGESAEENVQLTDAMERYLDTDDENEQVRLDQTINKLLQEEEQKQEDGNVR